MGRPLNEVLEALGARPLDTGTGAMLLDLSSLGLASVFGPALDGEGAIEVSAGDSFAFMNPPELAAMGTLWVPTVDGPDNLKTAIVEAHDRVKDRLADHVEALKGLGFKPRLHPPHARARAAVTLGVHSLVIAVDDDGEDRKSVV